LDCRHVCKTCAFPDTLQAGNQRSPQVPYQGRTVDDREQVRRARPRIGGHGMAFTVFPATQKESPAKVHGQDNVDRLRQRR
jgi:hypothetical protein